MKARDQFVLPILILCCAPVSGLSQPTQVRLLNPEISSNAPVVVSLSAPLGRTYRIDIGTNLTTWSPQITNIVSDSVTFIDTNAPDFHLHALRAACSWTVIVPNVYPTWQTNKGRDGRLISVPSGWTTNQGADGRMIGYPPTWKAAQGADGRMVAFPPGWTTNKSPDGRLVAVPPTGFSTSTNGAGRIEVVPTSGLTSLGPNAYLSNDWNFAIGGDGTSVAVPKSNFATNEGGDGRTVAYPARGWSPAHGADGRIVAFPPVAFTTNSGPDGRLLAQPASGWVTAGGVDGRRIAWPTSAATLIELDFEDQQFFAGLGRLKTSLSDSNFSTFLIYSYFGTGDQRFAR